MSYERGGFSSFSFYFCECLCYITYNQITRLIQIYVFLLVFMSINIFSPKSNWSHTNINNYPFAFLASYFLFFNIQTPSFIFSFFISSLRISYRVYWSYSYLPWLPPRFIPLHCFFFYCCLSMARTASPGDWELYVPLLSPCLDFVMLVLTPSLSTVSQSLWVHTCSCFLVSEGLSILRIICYLWLLHLFYSACCNDPWAFRGEVMILHRSILCRAVHSSYSLLIFYIFASGLCVNHHLL